MISEISNNWPTKKLGEIFDIKSSKRVHKSDWKKEGIPFYRAREIVKLSKNGFVDNDLFISRELYKKFTKETGIPKEGDFLISAVGTLGKCYLIKKSDRFYFKDASVLWFAKNDYAVDSRYIEHVLCSELVQKQIMSDSMGATVGTLTIQRAKEITIPLPPLPEQKRIVSQLDQLSEQTKKLEQIYKHKLKLLEELKQSVLQKAFAGEL